MATVKDLTDEDISVIKARAFCGHKYSDIASDYRLNQGRVADIKFGRIGADIEPSKKIMRRFRAMPKNIPTQCNGSSKRLNDERQGKLPF